MRLTILLVALSVNSVCSVFALPTSGSAGKALVARQSPGEVLVVSSGHPPMQGTNTHELSLTNKTYKNKLNAAKAEVATALAAFQEVESYDPRVPDSPEFIQRRERWAAARGNLSAIEEEVVVSADAPKQEKLKLLWERRARAESSVKHTEDALKSNQESADESIQWRQSIIANTTDEKERADKAWLLARVIEAKPETLARDQERVDEARQELAKIDAQIAANSEPSSNSTGTTLVARQSAGEAIVVSSAHPPLRSTSTHELFLTLNKIY